MIMVTISMTLIAKIMITAQDESDSYDGDLKRILSQHGRSKDESDDI